MSDLGEKQKLVFWMQDQFPETPSRTSAHEAAGMSGTHTMVAEMSAYIAENRADKYDVYVICFTNEVQDGVTFVDSHEKIPGTDPIVYCPTFFLFVCSQVAAFQYLRPRIQTCIVWLQCILGSQAYFACPLPPRTLIVAPSWFALTDAPIDAFHPAAISVIPNGLHPGIYDKLESSPSRTGTWTFHACWERGGALAYQAFCKYSKASRFIVANLNGTAKLPNDPRVSMRPRMSKRALATVMESADYFVYPLASPGGSVHHDTYACAVLEAMACGALVVSWKVACLPEVYGDHAILLDPPQYTTGSPSTAFGSCIGMHDKDSIDRIVAAIEALDADPEAKERKRSAAREWAMRQTWSVAGAAFSKVLDKSISRSLDTDRLPTEPTHTLPTTCSGSTVGRRRHIRRGF